MAQRDDFAGMQTRRWIAFLGAILLAGCGESGSAPRIEAVLPDRAAPGATVDLLGERFDGTVRFVSFGGVSASVIFWQAERARVKVPQLPEGHTQVVVTIDGRPSSAVGFYVVGRLDGGSGLATQ